jgi:protein tyrosine/serine phosphatase
MNAIPNLFLVNPCIYRGGQPTDDGWNWLHQNGIKRVIKLNTEAEGSDVAADALGIEVTYEPIPLLEQIVFRPNYSSVLRAVNAIQINSFIHCEHGQDRTGLIIGCYRVLKNGWNHDQAWTEMLAYGFHPELLGLTLFWEWAM